MKIKVFSRNGKKGNAALETITILLVMFVLAISGLYGYKLFDDLNTGIQTDDDVGVTAKETSSNLFSVYPSLIDNLFLFAFTLLVIFVLVSSFMIDSRPVFFIVTSLLLVSVFLASMFLGNAYEDFADDAELSSYANNLPYIHWVMSHILELIISLGFVIGIIVFIKFKGI